MRNDIFWCSAVALLLVVGGCPTGGDDDTTPYHGDDDAADDDAGDDDVGDDDAGDDDAGDDDGADDDSGDDDTTPPGPCPDEMALVDDGALRFCVDRWEAHCLELLPDDSTVPWSPYETVDAVTVVAASAPGEVPQAYVSGDEAAAACALAGKRLCTSQEYLRACRGPSDAQIWPYPGGWVPGLCNDDYAGHPVVDYFGTSDAWVWTAESMNDPGINQQPGTLAATGAHPDCVGSYGTYDMVGNLHEWVADVDGTFRGGFYVDVQINGPGCTYATTAHTSTYHDYSTGFRCCADPADR